ncbi:hypothetical protein D0C36_24150 [Mucilaginibacter conchicola]|uniref:Uncharacterized protein n=1 Tax=Mucilaginibacter conchicola TaxID=2303333 RepID=A0A372NLQ8_9SPHI|nr:hypothetical protein [Mucilaginibacter conchicola]RFZ89896.1 hypothetical protein D0C36_24150 [Mucilaginibacter conchicola]
MKKEILKIVFIACLGCVACQGNNKQKSPGSSSSDQSFNGSGDQGVGEDSGDAPAKGASSSSAIGGFDTSRTKLDTANTNPKK